MKKYQHGGEIYHREINLDFSANINPLGMPNGVKKAVVDSVNSLAAYPDRECRELIEKISDYEKIPLQNIVCGNGAADLIYRIVYGIKPKNALLISPTFSEYEKALSEVDCAIEFHSLSEENSFTLDEKILEKISSHTDIFFLCNPNNPVGNVINLPLLKKIINRCAEENVLLVIDECFMDFVEKGEKYSAKPYLQGKIIILKAFTKIYAMAGLRLGYILCGESRLAEKVKETGQCWSVSTVAQLAGIAALDENSYREKSVVLVNNEREFLMVELGSIGIKTFPSATNFILLKSELPLEERLNEKGIAIRNCENYAGLGKGFYRIAVRLHEENRQLLNELRGIVENG